jgi:hypothetical protein
MTGEIYTVSTLHGSTIYTNDLEFSSITVSSLLSTTNFYTSTLYTSSISITSYNLNQSVYGATSKKSSISLLDNISILSSSILARLDNPPSIPQVYTFGPSIQNRWVATGDSAGVHNLSISNDGITWTGVAGYIFNIAYGIAWNGSRWVAGGEADYASVINLAYSDDNGLTWVPVSSPSLHTIFSIIWDGTQWIAVGTNFLTNWIISSPTGTLWTNIPTNIGLTYCYDIVWNGSIAVAVGSGANTIIYSDLNSYTTWNPTVNAFSACGFGIAWNGRIWVAVGEGGSTIRYSTDAVTWINALGYLFSAAGNGIAWNGTLWVAVGLGVSSAAYSYDGITWVSGNVIDPGSIVASMEGVSWNGTIWIATVDSSTGERTAISYDGITWEIGGSIFNNTIQKVAFNSRRPYTLTFPTNSTSPIIGTVSSSVSFPISVLSTSRLDVVSDTYYNGGYTNFSITMNACRS